MLGVAWPDGDDQVGALRTDGCCVGELPLGHLSPHGIYLQLDQLRVEGCLVPLACDPLCEGRREKL